MSEPVGTVTEVDSAEYSSTITLMVQGGRQVQWYIDRYGSGSAEAAACAARWSRIIRGLEHA